MRDVALTLVVLGLLPLCFMRPWIGFVTWTWLGLMNPHRLTFGFAHDLQYAMAIGVATLVGWLLTRDKKPIPWNFELVLMVIIAGFFGFTCLFAWVPDIAFERWLNFNKVLLMAILATSVIYGRDRIRVLFIVVALSIGYYGVKGGVWVFATGGAERVQGPENTFISGNTFIGLAMVMVIPLLLTLAREETGKWRRRAYFAAAMLNIVAVVFTYSRGALIGLAVVLPLLFFRSKKKFLIFVVLIPLVIFGKDWVPEGIYKRADTISEYEQDQSAMQRIQSWTVAFNVAKESPLTGAGFNFESYRDNRRWLSYADPTLLIYLDHESAAHSIYFQLLGQHGFVGLGLFLLLLFGALFSLQKLKRIAEPIPELRWIGNYAGAVQVGLIGYMAAGAFLSSAYFDLAYIYFTFPAILGREVKSHFASAPNTARGGKLSRNSLVADGLPQLQSAQRPTGVSASKSFPRSGIN